MLMVTHRDMCKQQKSLEGAPPQPAAQRAMPPDSAPAVTPAMAAKAQGRCHHRRRPPLQSCRPARRCPALVAVSWETRLRPRRLALPRSRGMTLPSSLLAVCWPPGRLLP